MSLKLYFSNSSAGYEPPTIRGGWGIESPITAALTEAPTGASASSTEGQALGPAWDAVVTRFVSEPLTGDVNFVSGEVISCVQGAKVDNTTNTDGQFELFIYITTGDSDTSRGTILSKTVIDTTVQTTAVGQGDLTISLTGTVSAKAGDRIVVETGCKKNGTATGARTFTQYYGSTGTTDLAIDSANVTTEPAWISFPEDFPGGGIIGLLSLL